MTVSHGTVITRVFEKKCRFQNNNISFQIFFIFPSPFTYKRHGLGRPLSYNRARPFLLLMRVCCFRVFVDGELWDCLFVLKHNRSYALYTTIDQLPFQVSADLYPLRLDETRGPGPTVVDANYLERIIKGLEHSNVFKQLVLRRMNAVTSVDNNNVMVGVNDVFLVGPDRYRLPYTWYNRRICLIAQI